MGETVISETDKAYAAGIFDGEGYVGLARVGKRPYRLAVQIKMTNDTPLKFFEKMFGGNITDWMVDYRGGKRKPTKAWLVYNGKACLFLEAVLPYLTVKTEEAKEAIKFLALLPGRGYSLTPEMLKQQIEIYHRLRELKGRGYVRPDSVSSTVIREVK